jgi:MtN3 and saliva related transmembrane protein
LILMHLFACIGGGMVAFSYFPQLLRVIRLKTANEISMTFASTMFAGCLIWTAYAFYVHELPMVIFSIINTSQTGLLMTLKYVYSRNRTRMIIDSHLVRNTDTLVALEDAQKLVEEEQKPIEPVLN